MKKMFSFVLALVMCLTLCVPAFAYTKFPANETEGITRAHDVEYKRVEVGRETLRNVDTGRAGGQQNGPFTFPAGSFYNWTDGGSTASISLSYSYGIFNVSVPLGSTRWDTGSTSFGGPVPANKPFYIHVFRDIACIKYANYERPIGTSYDWSFRGYEYVTSIVGTSVKPITDRNVW